MIPIRITSPFVLELNNHHYASGSSAINTARMTPDREPVEIAREIVDSSLYMVVGTADRSGQPWATPVYFAPEEYRHYYWVSRPEAQHSRNLVERREVGIVIFDSTVPINTGQGVYILAVAQELPAHECADPIQFFSERGVGHGGEAWSLEDVVEPAEHRLYRATAEAIYVLDEHDQRVEVRLPPPANS
jgi:nitroimidazol reductase NimA-like FMN-containing flavoprotein (pyridoxamine 5'-phosphate oxidase superfamily)